MAREQNLDAALKKIAGGRIARANGLSADTFAATKKPCRKHAGIVKDQQIAGLKQVRKVAKQAVGVLSVVSLQMQHAGVVADGWRMLGNEFAGKMEMEVGN